MCRRSVERAVVSSRIECPRVEIPMVLGHNQQLGSAKAPFPFKIRGGRCGPQKCFRDTNDAIRVARFVYRRQPFALGMPPAEPFAALGGRNPKLRILEDLER